MLENSLALPDLRVPARYSCDVCSEGRDDEADMCLLREPQVFFGHHCKVVCGYCWNRHICHTCKDALADSYTLDHQCKACEIKWYTDNLDEFRDAVNLPLDLVRKVRLAHYQKLEKELA